MGLDPLRKAAQTILGERLVRQMKTQMPFGKSEAGVARQISKQRRTAARGDRVAQVTVVLGTGHAIADHRR